MSYNEIDYNEALYNAEITAWHIPLTDGVTATDAILKALTKALSDSVTPTEGTAAKSDTKSLLDTLFLQETFTKQVSNKGLADTIRLSDWITVKRNPGSIPWSD